jgi:hypothetical protein
MQVVRLPDGLLGLRRVWEDGWLIIVKLTPDYEALKLRWSVYHWGSMHEWYEPYDWDQVYDREDDDLPRV